MPSWNDIPGNPANFPANIRAAAGGENRSSTIFDREISDLADRTAWLRARQTQGMIMIVNSAVLTSDYIDWDPTGHTTFTAVTSNASAALTNAITGVAAGDRVHVHYGPFAAEACASDVVTMQVKVLQTSGGAGFEKSVVGGSDLRVGILDFHFEYISMGTGDITLGVYAKQASGSASRIFMGDGRDIPNWGPLNTLQYANWTVVRGI